jgi:hypothetical protein
MSTLKLAKMVETTVNGKQNEDIQLQANMSTEAATDSSFTASSPGQIKQSANLCGKIHIVAIKTGRNIVRISDDDQNRDSEDHSPDSDNSEVSRILLNMSGVGTISVTKYDGMALKLVDVKGNRVTGRMAEKNKDIIVDEQLAEEYIIKSDDDDGNNNDDDDDEDDGFTGFNFEETSNGSETEEFMNGKSGEGLQETVMVGELVPSECIEFEHLEVDRNGREHIAGNKSQKEDKLELQDSLK